MTPPAARPDTRCLAALAALLLAGGAWASALAQAGPPPVAAPSSVANPPPIVNPSTPARPAPARAAPAPKAEATPTWAELTPAQQQALAPLRASWVTLGEAHKRKWLAVSGNYPTMPPGEQARLHSRMAEWSALTPQQRVRARQNFFESQAVGVDDKKAKWEAYQALSPEEKRKLAAGAATARPVPPPTAAAVQPVPPQKLTSVPKPRQTDKAPRIAVVPSQVDQNTLLPQPGGAPLSTP
ncbi:MAG TPA: DUF3106 domain-containing protein [Ramlibacter sp.]|nr:DUF3106 domain-containing protein [Ramlibacter sp.]